MTHERFEVLADAYGGDVARWPAAERDAATLLIAREPEFARAVLAGAGDLDGLLETWTLAAVSHVLRDRVIASAPPARRDWSLRAWFMRAGVGAGLAAACAAGLIVGVKLSNAAAPLNASDETVSAALGDYDDLSGLGEGA